MRIYRITVILLVATIVYVIRLLFLGAAAAMYIYFLPSLIAERRNPLKVQPVFIINLAAGWMIIPWIIALVLAYKMDRVPQSLPDNAPRVSDSTSSAGTIHGSHASMK